MSAHAFGSEWAQLESYTFRFRDPLNKKRRFIPLRLDHAPIKGSLAQFLFIDWQGEHRDQVYAKLLEACRPLADLKEIQKHITDEQLADKVVKQYSGAKKGSDIPARYSNDNRHSAALQFKEENSRCLRVLKGHRDGVFTVTLSIDSRQLFSGSKDTTIRVWNVTNGECIRVLEGHKKAVRKIVLSSNNRIYSASDDKSIRVWNTANGELITTLKGHLKAVYDIAIAPNEKVLVSGSRDGTMRVWNLENMKCEKTLHYAKAWVNAIIILDDNESLVVGTEDGLITLWNLRSERQTSVLDKHSLWVWGLAITPDGAILVSGSGDSSVGVFDLNNRRRIAFLEGHKDKVSKVAVTKDGRWAVSGSLDRTAWIWELNTGKPVVSLKGHNESVECVAVSEDSKLIVTGSYDSEIRLWHFSPDRHAGTSSVEVSRYTNAKVLLVGESGAGKTGLSNYLAHGIKVEDDKPLPSTVGAWATHWPLVVDPDSAKPTPRKSDNDVEREVWLWDFGGQADQRLIHQLYMDDAALAVLVFDGQKDDLFETLGQWDRDLTRASRKGFAKLLVAGRVDAGGLRCSSSKLQAFARERGFPPFLETSAKLGTGCEELKQAILDSIRWEYVPWRTSPRLFKRLKEEIIRLKDEDRVLMRFNELRESLQLRMTGMAERFSDEDLKAVIGLLAGPGAVWELKFGSWVLLQPERINAYAQAVINTLREDRFERGCIPEEKVLAGDLKYQSSAPRLPEDEERIILLAMHQTLVERELCLREHTETGTLLIFPSYYRRERKELAGHPAVHVSYRFQGFLDDIYATLVVRLHYAPTIENDELWRYAADFKTLTGKQLGVKITRLGEGAGELEVYFDPTIPVEEKILFSKYIHEHVMQKGQDVVRLRHYVCPHCGTPVGNRQVAMRKLEQGKKDIPCVECDDPDKRIPLWDELEELFADSAIKRRVQELQDDVDIVLDSTSKERVLVGEVISTVALAGQLCEEFTVTDHGIDMEITFRNDAGEATGRKVYLQLKSGDSYLTTRKKDGAEIFKSFTKRHVEFWMAQKFPVILVIRNSKGEIRWMEIRDHLKKVTNNGKKQVRQIEFDGKRFDVMSVRRWRERMLDPKAV
jgi:small GTP-binding protein